MIVPEIRYFSSSDAEDPATFVPDDPARFAIALDLMIGPLGGEGEEQFAVQVATPHWLEDRFGGDGLVSGDHTLLVFAYDWRRIEAHLRKRVAACQGDDWNEVAAKLSRFAYWEFEDYVE